MDIPIPMPPESLRFMGKTDEGFLVGGQQLLEQAWELADLQPDETILEIGSGYGRIAHALLRRQEFVGTYAGMDILPRHVAWCAENLTPFSDGRFRFHHLNVYNARYNGRGTMAAVDVSFAFAGSATFVMLFSVFTHMYPDDIRHYLAEIEKVMTPDGRAVVTFFLQNESQHEGEAAGRSQYPLRYALDPPCRYFNPDDPLHVIAYEEPWVRSALVDVGLEVARLQLGDWCGRLNADKVGQDMLLLAKR